MTGRVMILSGAGLSAESGIKTFRDHDGLWENYDVMQVCSTQGWAADRKLVTQFYNDRRRDLESKKPNRAHLGLAALERRFGERIIHLTQNVDDMMERAGAEGVIHLHGTLRDLRCEACGETWDVGYRAQSDAEHCPTCGSSRVRHNVVMFGEAAPAYQYIYTALSACDLFVAIGTSGAVIDIVALAQEFEHSVIVNPKSEEHITAFGSFDRTIDSYFTHFIQKGAGDAMPELAAIIEAHLDS